MRELAAEVGIGFDTISAYENGRPMRGSTKARIVAVLETHGIEILNGDAPGARLRKREDSADVS